MFGLGLRILNIQVHAAYNNGRGRRGEILRTDKKVLSLKRSKGKVRL
jgi:hypothetical protein